MQEEWQKMGLVQVFSLANDHITSVPGPKALSGPLLGRQLISQRLAMTRSG